MSFAWEGAQMKLRYVCFLFALLGALICVTGCGLLENKQNVVASSQYTVDPIESALIRCDYNEDGALLGRTLIEWDTLQPRWYASISHDRAYDYKRNGTLRSATVCGAAVALREQEDGTLYGKGFDIAGGAHSVQYTLNERGRVVSELYTKGQRPYGVETFTYAYDDQGRLTSLTKHAVINWGREESVYTYEYTADTVALFLDGEPYATLCLDGNGMPLSYTWARNSEPTYTWQYDETGKHVPTSENTRWDYDENGRLTAILYLDENGEWQTVREYAFDKKGNITRSVKTTVD
jgi:YD repeat-containing protein